MKVETKVKSKKSQDYFSSDLKSDLLKQLPIELQEKWKNSSINEIQDIVNERKETGFETILGYHCSDKEFNIGDFIFPGSDNQVHYATKINKLYGKKAKFLYILEGSNQDKDSDLGLGWKTSFSRMKIVDKIPLTHEKVEEISADFAECNY